MKKIIGTGFYKIAVLILVMVMVLSGCGKKNGSKDADTDVTPTKGVVSAVTDSVKTSEPSNGIDSGMVVESKEDATADSEEIAIFSKTDVLTDMAAALGEPGAYRADGFDDSWIAFGSSESDMMMTDEGWGDSFYEEPGAWDDDLLIDGDVIIDDPTDPWEPEPEPTAEPVQPRAGLLTAGEWNDNEHMEFLRNLLANGQELNYKEYFTAWNLHPFNRIVVHVTDPDGNDLENMTAEAYSVSGNLLGRARTDNQGIAYIFYKLSDDADELPATVQVIYDDVVIIYNIASADLTDEGVAEVPFSNVPGNSKKLDLMMVIDTTGSMGDEISYLQTELEDVIGRVSHDNANLPIRLSVNFYRDMDDDYVVKSNPFSSNINEQLICLCAEYADGGGDYEEAVELALEDAVNNHEWSEDATRIMFLVLDAPPHNTAAVRASLASTLKDAAAKGIRIIPVASSGVDKSTEFLLRTFAMVTGGTYTFLTNDSGIGGSHIEPTIGSYEVEYLNDLMVRVIDGYLR